jgi:hypothetical protein
MSGRGMAYGIIRHPDPESSSGVSGSSWSLAEEAEDWMLKQVQHDEEVIGNSPRMIGRQA